MPRSDIQEESMIETDTDNDNSTKNVSLNASTNRSLWQNMGFEAENVWFSRRNQSLVDAPRNEPIERYIKSQLSSTMNF